jgi:hypothetical protein
MQLHARSITVTIFAVMMRRNCGLHKTESMISARLLVISRARYSWCALTICNRTHDAEGRPMRD